MSNETKAVELFMNVLGRDKNEDIHNKLSVGLVKSAKNWAVKHLKHMEFPAETKYLDTGRKMGKDGDWKNSPWWDFVQEHPRAFVNVNGKLQRAPRPLLDKQRKLIELKKKRVFPKDVKELVPPEDSEPNKLKEKAEAETLHARTMEDIKRIKSEIKLNLVKIKNYEQFYKPQRTFKPNIYLTQPTEFEEVIQREAPVKKRIIYRLAALAKKREMEEMEKELEILTFMRKSLHETIVDIDKDNYMRSNELWRSIKYREEVIKVPPNKETKKEELAAINFITEENLSDTMVSPPNPFKNMPFVKTDTRANWKNPNFATLFNSRVRSLLFAIRHNETTKFLDKIVKNEFKLKDLHNVEPWDIVPPKKEEEVVTRLEDRPDGMFKCNKCFSWKTSYVEKQTRSADEPMTIFVTCHACGNVMKR